MTDGTKQTPSPEQYRDAVRGVYEAARIIGHRAEAGAETWELVRGLAMMIDDLDRALGAPVRSSVELWCASDVLRADAQEPRVVRPREMEGE